MLTDEGTVLAQSGLATVSKDEVVITRASPWGKVFNAYLARIRANPRLSEKAKS